jgi:hypothetical protein
MSVAPLSTSTNLTQVPADLNSLPKEELVRLLKRVADERNDLDSSRAAKKPKATAVVTAVVTTTATIPAFNVAATKKRMASATIKAVKKAAHNRAKKPWTEISESLPNTEAALTLFEGYPSSSDTARMTKWDLRGADISAWLGTSSFVHPVKFDGKLICFGGVKPKIHAWAAYETLQVKFEKKTGHLTLKFRTFMAGCGFPNGTDYPPHMD